MDAELREMLVTKIVVGRPTDTPPTTGETRSTRAYASPKPTFDARIDAIRGKRNRLPEGIRFEADSLLFADWGADVAEGDIIAAEDGPYIGQHFAVLHVDPVHGDHYEVALKRVDVVAGEDVLA